ncbi:MAG: glycosyltransferase family 4 protein [Bacteroidales bacterium]|nr:glycosyltransferase family 4 protein [Bacteroidales bacterium]
MRICVISNGFQEDYIVHYLDSLVGRVDQIDFIGSRIYPREKIHPSVNFYDLKSGGIMDLPAKVKVRRSMYYYWHLIRFFMKKPRKGIVHLQWLRFKYLDGIFLPLFYKVLGYKLVYTVHDVVPHDRDTWLNRLVFKIIYKLNWKLIVHTEFIKNRLISEFGIRPDRIRVIHHGVYEVSEKELSLPAAEAKTRLGLDEKDYVILFFGFITHYKGLDMLLEAFSKVKTDKPIKLVVAGRSYEGYQENLKALQDQYNQETIRYIIRRIEDDELPLLFNAAELTVLPYREASQSGVLFMSYAYGVPVLVPDIGGFPFDIRDKETGILFTGCDTGDLTVKLEDYVNGKYAPTMMDREGIRKFAKDNYSWAKSGKEFVEFLHE